MCSLQITAVFPLVSEELPLCLPITLMFRPVYSDLCWVPRERSALPSEGVSHLEDAFPC